MEAGSQSEQEEKPARVEKPHINRRMTREKLHAPGKSWLELRLYLNQRALISGLASETSQMSEIKLCVVVVVVFKCFTICFCFRTL